MALPDFFTQQLITTPLQTGVRDLDPDTLFDATGAYHDVAIHDKDGFDIHDLTDRLNLSLDMIDRFHRELKGKQALGLLQQVLPILFERFRALELGALSIDHAYQFLDMIDGPQGFTGARNTIIDEEVQRGNSDIERTRDYFAELDDEHLHSLSPLLHALYSQTFPAEMTQEEFVHKLADMQEDATYNSLLLRDRGLMDTFRKTDKSNPFQGPMLLFRDGNKTAGLGFSQARMGIGGYVPFIFLWYKQSYSPNTYSLLSLTLEGMSLSPTPPDMSVVYPEIALQELYLITDHDFPRIMRKNSLKSTDVQDPEILKALETQFPIYPAPNDIVSTLVAQCKEENPQKALIRQVISTSMRMGVNPDELAGMLNSLNYEGAREFSRSATGIEDPDTLLLLAAKLKELQEGE